MELELDYSDLAKAGKLWVRCKTLAKGDDSAVKSGFVEIFGISHIDRLAIMRFEGERSRTIVPLENVYVLVKDYMRHKR